MITYYLEPNSSGTTFTGSGFTPDGTIPTGAIPCTQVQAQNPYAYAPDMSTNPPSVISAPSSILLAQAQSAQIALLQSAYQTAMNAPVTFTNAAGVTSTYPSGNTLLINGMRARDMLAEVIAAGSSAWTLGKWLDTNNVAQTFTFADLQGLAAAMEAAITLDWTDLVSKIAEVNAATTVAEVQAIKF